MSVGTGDIVFYKALYNNDTEANGGRIGTAQIVDNTLNNLFPNVTSAERVAGVTRYRKLFVKNNAGASGEVLQNTKVWIGQRSLGDDYFRLKAGTDTDVQSVADDYTNWAGAGMLNVAHGSGETQLVVNFDAGNGVFSGEDVWVHVDDGTGEVDLKVCGSASTPSWAGNTATIPFSGELNKNYGVDTLVSVMLDLGSLEASVNSWVETSASGTFNETTYPLGLYPKGTVTDSWTLTFSNATNFTVTGAVMGNVGSGMVSAEFKPVNGSSYYFRINPAGWGGSWTAGDTITFNTVHAAKGIWVKEVVPAGIVSYANNVVRLDGKGESA